MAEGSRTYESVAGLLHRYGKRISDEVVGQDTVRSFDGVSGVRGTDRHTAMISLIPGKLFLSLLLALSCITFLLQLSLLTLKR